MIFLFFDICRVLSMVMLMWLSWIIVKDMVLLKKLVLVILVMVCFLVLIRLGFFLSL